MPRDADFMLTAEEQRLRARIRRRRWVIAGAAVLLLATAGLAARPVRNMIKDWQARRHAAKAFALIEQEKWQEAQQAAVAGYQLRPDEPQAVRAVARFLSRVRQPQALEFWDKLKQHGPLTQEDLRDEAAVALIAGDRPRAEAAVKALTGEKEPSARDWLLAAQVAAQGGNAAEAEATLEKALAARDLNERTELQASLLRLGLPAAPQVEEAVSAERARDAWARVERIGRGPTSEALDALVVLSRQMLARPAGSESPIKANATELAEQLERHPLSKVQQKLLALDLRIHADSSRRSELIQQAIADWKAADAASVATLATWLNGKGEFQMHLDNVALETALQSQDTFLQHVDALGALGRWEDIRKLLDAERFPLDPMIQHMYLARTNAQLGNKTAAENSWQRALEATAADVRKLMTLAEYAEKNGIVDTAEAAYARAVSAAPNLRPAWQGRLRLAQAAKDTRRMHEVLAGMLERWPEDAAIQNDEAYTRLLLLPTDPANPALIQIEKLAENLVQQNPASLPHRTLLALAHLQQGRSADALRVYEGIQVRPQALTPSALAVHAAVLAANGHNDQAHAEAAQIPPDSLLPQEHQAIATLRE